MDYSYHISLGQVVVNSVDLEETVNKLNNENLAVISAKVRVSSATERSIVVSELTFTPLDI